MVTCTVDKKTPLGSTGDHDWVLVRVDDGVRFEGDEKIIPLPLGRLERLLWACPCGAFKWTSYAEWEAREKEKQEAGMDYATAPGQTEWP